MTAEYENARAGYQDTHLALRVAEADYRHGRIGDAEFRAAAQRFNEASAKWDAVLAKKYKDQ